jgi:hypothetical protein
LGSYLARSDRLPQFTQITGMPAAQRRQEFLQGLDGLGRV